jgi:hypothetical protein
VNESQAAAKHIYTKLSGASAVTALTAEIHDGLAPQGSALPHIVFSQQGGEDVMGSIGHRIFGISTWVVLARCEGGSWASADAIYSAADDALHVKSTTNLVLNGITYTVIWSRRLRSSFRVPELVAGRRTQYVGGIYEVQVTTC